MKSNKAKILYKNITTYTNSNYAKFLNFHNDKYEFSFDNVDNMGNFVEIEVKKIAKDNESEIKELIELLKSLKIDINLIESKRYFDYL